MGKTPWDTEQNKTFLLFISISVGPRGKEVSLMFVKPSEDIQSVELGRVLVTGVI